MTERINAVMNDEITVKDFHYILMMMQSLQWQCSQHGLYDMHKT